MRGEKVENFILKDQDGNDFELYRNLDKNLLLIFYPKDNTLVCSRQLSEYQQNLEIFNRKNINLAGISDGSLKSHKNFCNSLNLGFPLLLDESKSVCKRFDALTIFGMIKRKIIVINKEKRIILEKTNPSFFYPGTSKLIKAFDKINLT